MAWYRPLQRRDGRWDYVCTNSAGTFAIGYCFNGEKPFYSLTWDELADVVKDLYGNDPARWEEEKAKHAPRLANYHNTGHATAEEACECYRRYDVLEHSHRHDDEDAQKKCAICGEWTMHRVTVGTTLCAEYAICAKCDTEDNVLGLHLTGKAAA